MKEGGRWDSGWYNYIFFLFICCYDGLDFFFVRFESIISVHFIFGLLVTDVFVYSIYFAVSDFAVLETIKDTIFDFLFKCNCVST